MLCLLSFSLLDSNTPQEHHANFVLSASAVAIVLMERLPAQSLPPLLSSLLDDTYIVAFSFEYLFNCHPSDELGTDHPLHKAVWVGKCETEGK